MTIQQDDERRSSEATPAPLKVGKNADPGAAPPPRGYWLIKEVADKIARAFSLREYRGEVSDKVVPVMIVEDISVNEQDTTGADYNVITVDLTALGDRKRIVQAKTVSALWVDDLTAAATVAVRIGSRDPLTLRTIGQGYILDPPETIDISVDNGPQPGASLKLAVAFGVQPK
jgi:hypothetical protein